ncbi:MAG: RluA family pseudouridine synthase [Patescibacteria group bacterium]
MNPSLNNPSTVYDSPDFVVINKPSGLLTHPRNKDDQRPSVLSWFLEKYPEAKEVGEDLTRPGIVHRIDKETSGLLLLVKNQEAFVYYKHLFHDRLITKKYAALVYGSVKNDQGIIDAPLFKFGTRQSMRPPREGKTHERAALTEYRVLERFENYTLLEVSPKTGRTHQIRIHLRSIGHPIVCDPIYAEKSRTCPPELGRLFLHAKQLSFTTQQGQAMTLEADMPDELTNFLKSDTIAKL